MVIFFFPVFDVIICNVLYDTLYIELFIYAEKEKIIYTKRKKQKVWRRRRTKKHKKENKQGGIIFVRMFKEASRHILTRMDQKVDR